MRSHCEKTQSLLERYFDGELGAGQAVFVEDHVVDCPRCAAELKSLEVMRGAVQQTFREEAAKVEFADLWRAIEPSLAERKVSLWERIGVAAREYFSVYKPVWAAATAAVAIAAFVAVPLLLRDGAPTVQPRQSNECIIESIETSGSTAMVYDDEKDQTKVIWLFEDPEDSGQEPSSL